MLMCLLPHIFLVYCVLSGLLGLSCFSFIATFILVCLLEKFRLAPASPAAVKRVLNTGKTSIIAHRGAAHDAPENTLGAFRKAKENGADGVEFDVEFSSDGVAVLLHDDTVDRTTDGEGAVRQMSFQKLQTLSASAKHPRSAEFPDEKIVTLEEAVKLCLELELKMYLDVKGDCELTTASLTRLFQKYPAMYDNAIVCSFWPQVVYKVRRADPRIVTGLTHRRHVLTRKIDGTERAVGPLHKRIAYPIIDVLLEWAMHAWLWYLCGSSAFLAFVGDLSPAIVSQYAERGIQVVAWTANSPVEKAYIHSQLHCSYMTDTLTEEGCGAQKN